MAIPIYEISHSGTRNEVFASQGQLTDCLTIQTNQSVKAKVNTASLKFSNPKSPVDGSFKFADRFLPDDELSIKLSQGMVSGNVPVGFNQIIDAQAKEWDYNVAKAGRFLTLKSNDILSKLSDVIVQLDFPAEQDTAKQVISDVVSVEINSRIDQQSALGTRSRIDLSKMATAKKNGGTFDPIPVGYSFENKTVRQVIDEMSTDTNTKDGNYLWWLERIGTTYFLRWEPKPDTFDRQINEEDTLAFNPVKSTYDIKNYLYLECGEDDNNQSIRTHELDMNSIVQNGWKETMWAYPDAARQARTLGLAGNDLISAAKLICKAHGKARLEKLNRPRWKCDVTLRGTSDFSLANQVYVFSKGLGGDWIAEGPDLDPTTNEPFTGFKLRIQSINHKYSEKGWETTLGLEEDPAF